MTRFTVRSLSLRRAWIEIIIEWRRSIRSARRSPYGERGLKYGVTQSVRMAQGRSPYGERGLKLVHFVCCSRYYRSLSLRRAWIEIRQRTTTRLSRPSFSLRKAWIEIDRSGCAAALLCVSASWHPQYRHYFSAA